MNAQGRKTCIAACAAVCMSLFAASLFGGSRTVSTVEDLVTALNEFNGDSGSTITVAKGVYDVKDCAMEKAHLSVDKLTLKGATSDPRDVVIYDSAHANRIFYLNQGQIQNLTVSNGYLSTGHGVGILGTDHWYSRIENVVITCCEGPNSEGVACRTLATARNCQMIANTGKYGGGAGDVYYGEYAARSGGLIDCVIRDNTVTVSGGGVMNSTASGTVIANNSALRQGGGVFDQVCGDYLKGCTVVSNSASAGGGVYTTCSDATAEKRYQVTNSLIAANFAFYCGGGLCLRSSNPDYVIDCVISNNVCDGSYDSDTYGHGGGGGICKGIIIGCTVIGNSVTNNAFAYIDTAMFGGGLLDCPFVTNTLIVGNSTVNRGGGADKCTLVDCVVSNNLSHYYGGGVSRSVVTGSKLVFNSVKNTNGYRPQIDWSGTKLNNDGLGGAASSSFVTNSLVAGNACIPTPGRVVEPTGAAGYDTVFSGCEIRENYAPYVPAMNKGSAYGCTFRDNASDKGTHIFRTVTTLEDCDICGGQFMDLGRIVNCRVHGYVKEGYATIAEGANVHTSGTFAYSGSPTIFARWATDQPALAATNLLVYGNQCQNIFAGVDGKRLSIVNCSFVSNRYDGCWTRLGVNGEGEAEAINLLFVENRTMDGGAACDYNLSTWGGNTNVVMRNCIFGVKGDYGLPKDVKDSVFGATVRFVEPSDPDWPYQPTRTSLAGRKGLVQDWMVTATDIRGADYPRLRDGKVDIGCYQNWMPIPGMMLFVR